MDNIKKDNHTMLPTILLHSSNEKVKSLYQECKNHKILLVMDYLHVNTNRFGLSYFTIEDIITYYKLIPKTGKGKMNEQIKNIIQFLQFKGLISNDFDIKKVKINEIVRCSYIGIEKNKEGKGIKFTKVNYEYMDWIISYKDDSVDNVKLLFYYCYLCSRMHTRKKGEEDINKNGGRAEPCFPSYDTITKDIDIADKTIKIYNDILVKLNIIRIGNCGLAYYKNDSNKTNRETPNFYTHYTYQTEDMKDEDTLWFENLKRAMKVFKDEHTNMVFRGNREYKDNNKSINGFISRIDKLETLGKATPEQIEERNNYIKSKNYKEETITSIREQIDDINRNLTENDPNDKFIFLHEQYEEYFEDKSLDKNNIEDCKDILEFIKGLEVLCSSQNNGSDLNKAI